MKLVKKTYLALMLAAACTASSAYAEQAVTWENSDLHTVSLIMSEPMMKVDGSYHELLDAYYLKPLMTKEKVVIAPLDDIFDELNGEMSFDGKTVEYRLNKKVVSMVLDSADAVVNGKTVKAPAAPQIIEGALYVPFRFVFEGLGAKYTWNSSRHIAEVTLLRPSGTIFKAHKGKISAKTILKQKPEWFASKEAKNVAEAMLANQNVDGGWFKIGSSNDLSVAYDRDTFPTYRQKSTIDNDATNLQIEVLAKINQQHSDQRLQESIIRGVEYLINGQYDNGGWPQFFPQTRGYHRHVTFNDNAISNTLNILEEVANKTKDFAFVSDDLATRAKASMNKGIRFILDNQVVVNGVKTGWCAQYNVDTLACERGRSYELASISGDESVKVIKFLMSIDKPSSEVVDAINSSVAFLKSQSIKDKKLVKTKDDTLEFGRNRIVIDKQGSTVWPRFINTETLQPLFSNRQGDHLDAYEKVSYERRVKYSWLVTSPGKLIKNNYPKWQAKYSPKVNVLAE
ncbi:pectate lyase [Agarivorans sp. Z349TD_8]|uniref:pectate lyase n=1 Tax=Agarivorans sp. Z349TD_8 TaxID=3421434 RepID=UPI003D7EFF99